jgi:hypothetical protein
MLRREVGRHAKALATASMLVGIGVLQACGGGGDPVAPDVPPTVAISSAGGSTVASGATLALTVRATNRRGAVVQNPPIAWTSGTPTVASVSATGVVTGAVAGTSSITATYDGVSAAFTVTVTPGVPVRLAIRTQPAGAASGVRFVTQPVVEVRDAADNVVTASSVSVTASLATGGGVLGGVTSTTATQGVATFADLQVSGTVGARTVSFAAAGLTPVTSAAFALDAGVPARLAIRTQAAGAFSGAAFTTQPVIEVRDDADNLVTSAATPVTAAISSGGGTIGGTTTVTAVQGVASFTTLRIDGLVGNRVLVFSSAGLTAVTGSSLSLQAGAATTVVVRTAPSGGGLNGAFTTQPIVELRDGAGNLASSANATVTASITSGTGTLTGATSTAVGGVATFTGFGIVGAAGARTISVSATGLTAASFSVTPCDLARNPEIQVTPSARTLDGFGTTVVFDTVAVTDRVASCQAITGISTSIVYGGPQGWLSATVLAAPSRVVLRADPSFLTAGTYTATVTATSVNGGSTPLSVTFIVRPTVSLTLGDDNEKIRQLDPNGTLTVPAIVREGTTVLSVPVQYVSRSTTVATVSAGGTITGRSGGQTWIVASTTHSTGARDSLFVNVTRTTGPLLRADVTRFVYARAVDFSVTLYLDTRGATVGAADVVFTWPTNLGTPALLRLNGSVPGASGSPVITSDAGSGTTRISIASATGLTGVILLGRFDFTPLNAGASQLILRFNEILDPLQQSLLANASALQYPVVIR